MIDDVAGETAQPAHRGRRLESWKEIASYLGRDVRTLQRWEAREGLPVHRQQHLKLGSVFAFTAELDGWRKSKDSRSAASVPLDRAARAPDRREPARRLAPPALVAAVVLAAIPLVGLTWRVSPSRASFQVKSLAVLPLDDRSHPPDDEYFADGLTKALIGRVSSMSDVRVISRPSIMPLWFLGFALIDSGKLTEAIQTLERLAVVWDRNPAGLAVFARAYHLAGRTGDARALVEELERRAATTWVPAAVFVNAYAASNPIRSLAALERAYAERSNIVQFLKTHPVYDGYRSDSRFIKLLRRVRLD